MSLEQLEEYRSQLIDIEELLQDDPTDESLLKLKSDLLELIELTLEDETTAATTYTAPTAHDDTITHTHSEIIDQSTRIQTPETLLQDQQELASAATSTLPIIPEPISKDDIMSYTAIATGTVQQNRGGGGNDRITEEKEEDVVVVVGHPARKKLKKLSEFEIPSHLHILDTDSEKEKQRKRRALKSLKSKHREKQREYESTKKQQSWQSFHKKSKKSSSTSSIFATHDGVHSKVGVVSAAEAGSGMTESHERKRHKF